MVSLCLTMFSGGFRDHIEPHWSADEARKRLVNEGYLVNQAPEAEARND